MEESIAIYSLGMVLTLIYAEESEELEEADKCLHLSLVEMISSPGPPGAVWDWATR